MLRAHFKAENVGTHFRAAYHKIVHFASERDFNVLRNHMFSTYLEAFNLSQKIRNHWYSTLSQQISLASLAIIRLVHIMVRNCTNACFRIKIALTNKVYYFMVPP